MVLGYTVRGPQVLLVPSQLSTLRHRKRLNSTSDGVVCALQPQLCVWLSSEVQLHLRHSTRYCSWHCRTPLVAAVDYISVSCQA